MLSRILARAALALALVTGVAHAGGGINFSIDVTVAAGAAVSSGIQSTGLVDEISCIVTNNSAGARNFTVSVYRDWDNATPIFTSSAISVGATTTVLVNISAWASGANSVGIVPFRYMKFDLASGGAGSGVITCIGR